MSKLQKAKSAAGAALERQEVKGKWEGAGRAAAYILHVQNVVSGVITGMPFSLLLLSMIGVL